MWILPKQLHTSPFVQDTKALDLDSEEFSQICERSLTWRGKDSLQRTWLQRWKRANWMKHLCIRTLRPSHTESFEDAWTFSLEASRANPSVLLESVKQLKTQDTSSLTSQTELESANLELFFSKTYKESSAALQGTENQFSNMSSEHWKKWVTEQRQEYSQRKKLAHLIRESESTSLAWSTPIAGDWKGQKKKDGTEAMLCAQVKKEKNWPTASARDWKDTAGMSTERDGKALGRVDQLPRAVYHHDGLQDQANPNTNGKNQESWPTPVCPAPHDSNNTAMNGRIKRKQRDLGHATNGKLNPNWVEQLMGLPVGWTDLGYWETESFQQQQQEPLVHLSKESYEGA